MSVREKLNAAMAERILILDGAMGSMVQAYRFQDTGRPPCEQDYRGQRFANHTKPLAGCNDVLCLTKPEIIIGIHEAYLDAGADIIETCSLNSTSAELLNFGLEGLAYEISRASAQLARKAVYKFSTSDKPRFAAGSMGPTAKSAAITRDVDNPQIRQITWDVMEAAYYDNARGLVDGGADFLLIETVYDTLNAKAAVHAIQRLGRESGRDIPIVVSATFTETGRIYTGQTPEAFCVSMLHANPLALGLNCSFGADKLQKPLGQISAFAGCPVCFYPNAGFPDAHGHYTDSPETMAAAAELCMKDRLVNIIGGCCGSTPAHISAIAAKARNYGPRPFQKVNGNFTTNHTNNTNNTNNKSTTNNTNNINAGKRMSKNYLCGTQVLQFDDLRLQPVPWQAALDRGDFEEAVNIAREAVSADAGKQIKVLAVNADRAPDPLNTLRNFIFLTMAYSDLAVFPVLIESSSRDLIVEGLKCIQGRGIVRYTGASATDEISRIAEEYGAGFPA